MGELMGSGNGIARGIKEFKAGISFSRLLADSLVDASVSAPSATDVKVSVLTKSLLSALVLSKLQPPPLLPAL